MDNGFYNGLERKNLIFNWHDIEEQGFYHSNGNYESGCTTVPAEDIENKHAIVIGSGIAGRGLCLLLSVRVRFVQTSSDAMIDESTDPVLRL